MYVTQWKPVLASVFIALLLFASVACNGPIGAPGAGGGARYIYIEPEVTISHLPKLYEPFTVTGKATDLRQDLADAELWLNVTNVVYLDGEDRWHSPLKEGEEKTISATFAFVTEGNQNAMVSAVAGSGLVQPGLSRWVGLHITESRGKLGVEASPFGNVTSCGPGDPHFLLEGVPRLVETALALNPSPSPRIELIHSLEDLTKLQKQGLAPQELRYSWGLLESRPYADFSKMFLIAHYDGLRPTPGHLVLMESNGRFLWDNGTLKANLKTHEIPPDVSRASKPTSSVTIYAFGRDWKPCGLELFALQGTRTFEFSIDGQPLPPITIDLKMPEEPKVP